MSIVDVEFIGGPFDGANEAKDASGFSWVIIPHQGRQALYQRLDDGRPYKFSGYHPNAESALDSVKKTKEIVRKAFDKGLWKGNRP